MKKWMRIFAGAGLWAALGLALTAWAQSFPERGLTPAGKIARDVGDYFAGPKRRVSIRFERPVELALGDPIFISLRERPVGWVTRVAADPAGGAFVQVRMSGEGPALPVGTRLLHQTAPDSLTDVFKTLLPEPKRTAVLAELQRAFLAHQDEMAVALTPIVEQTVGDVFSTLEESLAQSVRRHQEEIEILTAKYQQEIVGPKVVPLVRGIVWPILRHRASPVAGQIGREIWQRASLWRFGWRYLYDAAPLPDLQLLDKEWQRFVAEDVSPVFENHVDELVDVLQEVVGDSLRHPEVQAVVRSTAQRIVEDPQLRRLARTILNETVIENPAVWEAVRRRWTSLEAQQALRLCATKMEPSFRKIGEVIFGSQEGISPEFAEVLRRQILGKDQHWLTLESSLELSSSAVGVVTESDFQP